MSLLPRNIRVNTSVPFPAQVQGAGPIGITKVNGVWIVSFAPQVLAVQTPPLLNYPTDFVVVYDSVAKSFFQMPISALAILASGVRLQRSIVNGGALPIQAGDSILNINAAADLAPTLPGYATRIGAPLTFNNLPASHLQTLTASGAEKINGFATYPLVGGASVTLLPFNDGINTGYAVE